MKKTSNLARAEIDIIAQHVSTAVVNFRALPIGKPGEIIDLSNLNLSPLRVSDLTEGLTNCQSEWLRGWISRTLDVDEDGVERLVVDLADTLPEPKPGEFYSLCVPPPMSREVDLVPDEIGGTATIVVRSLAIKIHKTVW